MTVDQYLQRIFKVYKLVSKLSDKNSCKVLRLRNSSNGRDMVARISNAKTDAYKLLQSVCCAHLPLVYDVIDLEDGQIVLEQYIDGIALAQQLECKLYSYSEAKRIVRSVCNALTVLHDRGIVHRDVKPENVMMDKNGTAVLIDLNASRTVNQASKDTVIMGTVGYASPEQLGITQSDARTDIYAVGILLNVMLTGKHPSQQLASGKGGSIVQKCTNVNPDQRYQSAQKLCDAL